MSTAGYDYLSAVKITRIMDGLQDIRTLPQNLWFVNRTPFTPANDNEIVGRWINRLQIADIVADDARALTYSAGKLQLEQTINPNIKLGRRLTQEHINQLASINEAPTWAPGSAQATNNEIFGNFLPSIVENLRTSIYQRCEALIVAMHLDGLTYDRFGMKIAGSWGIPASLKVTPVYPWTDAVNATPVNDIWTVKRNASVQWGMNYDRLIMSTSAFMLMISTAEFQAKARVTVPLNINFANIPTANLDYQEMVAKNIIGIKELVLYDARYWSQDQAGYNSSAPYLPINKVILGSTANDNNPSVQDFTNGITTESRLSSFLPNQGTTMIGRFNEGKRGPIAYTSVDPNLDPPTLTVWAVMRGFPRRSMLQANAVLTVGTFTDGIPIQDLFP